MIRITEPKEKVMSLEEASQDFSLSIIGIYGDFRLMMCQSYFDDEEKVYHWLIMSDISHVPSELTYRSKEKRDFLYVAQRLGIKIYGCHRTEYKKALKFLIDN